MPARRYKIPKRRRGGNCLHTIQQRRFQVPRKIPQNQGAGVKRLFSRWREQVHAAS